MSGCPKIHIVSYPKSGRTWLRLLISRYLVDCVSEGCQDIEKFNVLCRRSGLPEIVFTHAGSDLIYRRTLRNSSGLPKVFKRGKVLFLTRNVEDTLVSAFYQAKYRKGLFQGEFSEFIRDDAFGLKRILRFHAFWSAHHGQCGEFHTISYEQLHEDTYTVLSEVLKFLGIDDQEGWAIRSAIAFCDFDNLQMLERQGAFSKGPFQARDTRRIETYKFRSGTIGNYKRYLSDRDMEFVTTAINENKCELLNSDLLN